MKLTLRSAVFFLATTVVVANVAAQIRTVALTGDPAPGTTPDGWIFGGRENLTDTFGNRAIDSNGDVAFSSYIINPGYGDGRPDWGVWFEDDGVLQTFYAQDRIAGASPDDISDERFHASGRFSYFTSEGLWLSDGDVATQIASGDQQPPGMPEDIRFLQLGDRYRGVSDEGATLFEARLTGTGISDANDAALYMADEDSLVLLAREATQAHHLPPDVVYADFLGRFVGPEKEAAYAATLTGDGVDASNNTGIWRYANGSHTLLLRAGDLAPGTTPGTVFSQVGLAVRGDGRAVGGHEHLLISADLSGPDIDSTNDTGIWAEEAGGFRLVVQEGDPVPGRPTGETFSDLTPLGSTSSGDATFFTRINGNGGASAREIWSEVDGQLQPVVRSRDPAPGMPDGNTLFLRDHNHVAVNSAGQVVFSAIVSGPNSSGATIWATDATGELKLIANRGDQIEVAPGDTRTIGDLDTLFSQHLGDVINDRGQIVFHAKFGLHEGIFVSDAVAIPEPSALILMLTCCGFPFWHKARKRND